jgi:hypothetical protein
MPDIPKAALEQLKARMELFAVKSNERHRFAGELLEAWKLVDVQLDGVEFSSDGLVVPRPGCTAKLGKLNG